MTENEKAGILRTPAFVAINYGLKYIQKLIVSSALRLARDKTHTVFEVLLITL